MKILWTSLRNNKKYLEFCFFFLILGFLIGFLIYLKFDHSTIEQELSLFSQSLSEHHIQYLGFHFLLLSIFIACSFTLIGVFLFPIYILFEGVCIMYHICTFTSAYHLSGFIYSLISNMILKAIFLMFLILFFKSVLNIVKKVITNLKEAQKEDLSIVYTRNIKRILFSIIGIFLNDLFLYFFGNKILSFFLFIID